MRGQKFEFTDEQINYIIDNWGKETPHSMKKRFGCSWYAVTKVATIHGLEVSTSNEWSEEDVTALIELSDKFHYIEMAEILHRTPLGVYLKARRLGITLIQDRRKWTPEEEEEFKELWGYKPIEIIAKKLKRSIFSLKVKAVRLNLGPMIKNNLEKVTVSDIADMLQVTKDRILNNWKNNGLKLKKVKVTSKWSYYTISLDNLVDFLEKNQEKWDSRLVDPYVLGCEPEWLQEKRRKDRKDNPIWYHFWTDAERERADLLRKRGKTDEEIGMELGRTENAVFSEFQKKLTKKKRQ